MRKGYPQRVDNSRCQQQRPLSSFDVRRRDEIDRIENNVSLYKPRWDKVYRRRSAVNPVDLDWKTFWKNLKIFSKKRLKVIHSLWITL